MLDVHHPRWFGRRRHRRAGAPRRRRDPRRPHRRDRRRRTSPRTRTIDADGKVVAPGFVDIHTHYDAQVFWDTTLSPVAAARRHDRDRRQLRLHDRAARPRARRVPDAHARPGRGHAAVGARRRRAVGLEDLRRVPRPDRRHARAERRLPRRPLDDPARRHGRARDARARRPPEDLAAMEQLLDESLAAGGLGFSSSWARTHNDADGDMVPSRYATEEELVALCTRGVAPPGHDARVHPVRRPVRGLRARPDDAHVARREPAAELERAVRVGRAAKRWPSTTSPRPTTRAERGGRVLALTMPDAPSPRICFDNGFLLDTIPGWQKPMTLPHDEKKAMLASRGRPRGAGRGRGRRQPGSSASRTGRSTSSTRRSRPRTSSTRAVPSPTSPRSRTRSRSTRCSTSSSPTTS